MKTYNRPSIAAGPARPFSAELAAVWEVLADRSYDVTPSGTQHMVAIRTHSGEGEISLHQRRPLLLEPGSLIVVESSDIARYRCSANVWGFWWFAFLPSAPLPYALATLCQVGEDPQDSHDFQQLFTKLQHPTFPVRCIASAIFTTMLQRWLADAKLRREQTPHRQIVETMIARIHRNVADDWSGPRLAREAGLSESTFRSAFKQATGLSPARFIRDARLQAAYQILQQRSYTLAAIAEQLNFSSAFHLSAAFKKQFGFNPSAV